jgi:tellurite methyltransferase
VSDWRAFYDAVAQRPPHDTLLQALDLFAADGVTSRFAVDLGCGDGRDTVEILRRGWRVLAIDAEAEAIRRLRSRSDVPDGAASRLSTEVARFEDAAWPSADLVNASFSLPFCPPVHFSVVWQRVVASILPGGRFSGQLFGERDEWADQKDMTFHSRGEVEQLLRNLEVECLDELEEDGTTALGERKRWHVFHIVARAGTSARPRPAAVYGAVTAATR